MPAVKSKLVTCKRTLVYPVCRSKPTGRFRTKTKGVKCSSDLRTLCRSKRKGTWTGKPASMRNRAEGVNALRLGTRMRFSTWTGTYVGDAHGKKVFKTSTGHMVSLSPLEVSRGQVTGRSDSGTAHRSLQMAQGRRRNQRVEGRGIDDDDGPRGTGPQQSMSWGVMPPRANFRSHFNYYVGEGGRYRIRRDPVVGDRDLTEAETFALVKRYGNMLGSSRKGSEDKASLASAIMETLGFEWI